MASAEQLPRRSNQFTESSDIKTPISKPKGYMLDDKELYAPPEKLGKNPNDYFLTIDLGQKTLSPDADYLQYLMILNESNVATLEQELVQEGRDFQAAHDELNSHGLITHTQPGEISLPWKWIKRT